jgi:hypothetical protein
MILQDHNLYGWGASNIGMPRVVFEPHAHRPRKSGKIIYGSRGAVAVCRWHASRISRIFLDDYPWSQIFLLGIFSMLIIAYFFMLNRTLTRDQARTPVRPVKIVVALQKDEPRQPVIPDVQPPAVAKPPEPVHETLKIETPSKALPKAIVEKPKEIEPQEPKKLPAVEIKQPKLAAKKTPVPQPVAPATEAVQKQTTPKQISITPATVVKRQYTRTDTAETKPSRQVSKTVILNSPKNQKLHKGTPVQIRKADALQNRKQNDRALQRQTTANLYAHNPPDITVQQTSLKSKIAGRRYTSKTNALLPAGQAPPTRTDAQMEFAGTRASAYQPTGKRYSFKNNDQRPVQVPRSANRKLSFASQKQQKNELPALALTTKMIAATKPSATKSSGNAPRMHNFPDTVAQDEIDSSQLISLQAFNVCKDPEMEFHQKTQMAAHLLQPTRIAAQGVVFFVKYTESGYTIQIHIYNPHGRSFKDRCEVLDLALDRILNRVN